MPPEPAPPMETRCRARPESICGGREGTWEQLGAQKRKIAVPSMPSEPAMPMETQCRARPESIYRAAGPGPCASRARGQATLGSGKGCRVGSQDRGGGRASRAGPAHGNPMPGKARIHLAGGGREHGSNWGPRNGRSQCLACRPSRPCPWKPDAGQGPESIYRGPKPLVLARLVTGAGTNSSVNGFGPCPASGFHGRGQLGRHARHRDLPFRGSHVPSCPGTHRPVNGFRPCPASGFHGHGRLGRHAKDCDLPFRGPHVPEYGLV